MKKAALILDVPVAIPCLSESRLERMDLNVVLRIARHLREDADLGITRLAIVCRMKHTTCKNYLNCMETLGWITHDRCIRLTPEGYRILK
ncbi:MAG: hypothetical protein EB829_03355 [Nitrosopumilus sp. H8]|nr:MAG: hypothetical protein EB830_04790 [Nitrosopumilus sp. H13]RNJ78945.1 MAG: hypothetical protein EB829_03355 [Nitrosopumilus sp. H8]